MVDVVRVIFLFLDDFYFLCEILRVWLGEETAVGGVTEPVGACLELIGVISIVILFGFLLFVLIGVSALASQWKVAAGVLVRGLYVLIVSLVAWELSRV